MKSFDVTAILKSVGLPVYYIYPQESISKTVPCLTYLLDKRGCEGEPNCKTTITVTAYCSIPTFDVLADTMEAMIYALPCLDRVNVRRVDQYENVLELAKCTWTIPIQG
jgi:hypothetical protein